jgi:hypothetical protein
MPEHEAMADTVLCLFRYSVLLGCPPVFAGPLAGNFQPAPGSFGIKGVLSRTPKLKGNKFTNYRCPIARLAGSQNRGTTDLLPFDDKSVVRSVL